MKKANRKNISICIASFNGGKYIKKQLESIIPQLNDSDEIIISDDGSIDDTILIINSIQDKRIKLIFNTGKHGYTSNFENALRYASNDYIFLCDQDDIWTDNKVEICLKKLEKSDFIVHDAIIVNASENILKDSFFNYRNVYSSFCGNLFKFGYLGCCFAFHKRILDKALPFPKNHKLCTHDNWLFLIGKLYYSSDIIPDKLILYRRHQNNVSSGGDQSHTSFRFKLTYRFYLVYNLLLRR